MTEEEKKMYESNMKNRPHVVLLGAGASCAAIPNGDKNGKKICAMDGFIDKLGLTDILKPVSLITESGNLEDIYMELDARSGEEECAQVKEKLEQAIYDYMSDFELPDEPTVYDYLVASLSSKDLIATFNWDPLLVQALKRVGEKISSNLPHVAFLHGNVAVGFCEKDSVMGCNGSICSKCGKVLIPTKLLYPVKNKNYDSQIPIRKSWNCLNMALEDAYMFTIFGYSAPKSDVSALAMLKKAWGNLNTRNLEQIEFVDLKSENEIRDSWKDFIHSHHYSCHESYFDTFLAKFPQKSCSALFDQTMNCTFLDGSHGIKSGMSFKNLKELIEKQTED